MKILVVEDESAWRKALTQTYREMGFHVTTAEDEETALDLLDHGGFHAVSLDWHIEKQGDVDKGIDSDAILEEIGRKWSNIVVIVVTSLGKEKYENIRKGDVWKVIDKQKYVEEAGGPGGSLPKLVKQLERDRFVEVVRARNPGLEESGPKSDQVWTVLTPDEWWRELEIDLQDRVPPPDLGIPIERLAPLVESVGFHLTLAQISEFVGVGSRVVQGWGLQIDVRGESGKGFYRISAVRKCAAAQHHNLAMSNGLIRCVIGNFIEIFGRKIKPKIGPRDRPLVEDAAYKGGLEGLKMGPRALPGAFLKGVIHGFDGWLLRSGRPQSHLGPIVGLLEADSVGADGARRSSATGDVVPVSRRAERGLSGP